MLGGKRELIESSARSKWVSSEQVRGDYEMKIRTHIVMVTILLFAATHSVFSANASWNGLYRDATELYKQGKWADAMATANAALREAPNKIGPNSIYVAKSLTLLGDLNKAGGNMQQACRLYRQALAMQEKLFGPKHPNVDKLLTKLGDLYVTQGQVRQAQAAYSKVVTGSEERGRTNDLGAAGAICGLASVYRSQGRYAEAEKLFTRALQTYEIHTQYQKDLVLDVGKTYENLASLSRAQGDLEKTANLYQHAIENYDRCGPDGRLAAASALTNLGDTYTKWQKRARALICYKRALGIEQEVMGPNSLIVALTLRRIGDLHQRNGNMEEAERTYTRAVAVLDSCSPEGCPLLAQTLKALADIYQKKGQYAEAMPLYKRIVAADR